MNDGREERLEPDRSQLEIFTEALFRYAPAGGYVSLRAFYDEDQKKDEKPFRITPVQLNGNGLRFLWEAAEDDARRAAQAPRPVVFVRRFVCSAARTGHGNQI